MGVFYGTETFTWPTLGNLLVITVGVVIAAYGEINFVLVCTRRTDGQRCGAHAVDVEPPLVAACFGRSC